LEKYLYLFSQLGVLFLLSFTLFKLFKQLVFDNESLIKSIFITVLLSYLLDYYFTLLLVIEYNKANLAGLFAVNIPIEKIVSNINLQLLGCLTYFKIKSRIENYKFRKLAGICNAISLPILVLLAIKFITKSYSFYVFFLASIYLSMVIIKKARYLQNFYLTIFLSAIPVLLLELFKDSFGIIQLMKSETSGILIFNLTPLESYFFDYFVLLMTISIYEYFSKRKELNLKYL
jgi:hypothetical protein